MKEENENKELFFIRRAANLLQSYTYHEDKAWEKVRLQSVDRRSRRHLRLNWLKYAAVFVVGMGAAWWGYRLQTKTVAPEISQVASIPLSGQQAELILATGQRVILDDSLRGKEVSHGNMNVYLDSTQACLKYNNRDTLSKSGITGCNTLRIPKGKDYTLVLPDGSEVRLNSETSLRFPVAFEEKIREVYLEGEAFFNVKPDPKAPFHVYAAGRDICVLGTCFNVSAYENDPYFQSTLVTGKVKVSGGSKEVILQPSEQYFEDQLTGEKGVRQVDTQLYTSWLEGKIRFKGERLEDIVKKLQRWFDFEIFYADEETKDMKFRGVIDKHDSFDTVLKHLEQTTDILFNIQNKTVIVRKIHNN